MLTKVVIQAMIKNQICLQHLTQKFINLTDKELQVLKNIFGYKNPEGLRQV